MAQQPGTNRQVPDNSILDHFNKQKYLGNYYNYILSVSASGTSETAEILLVNPVLASGAFPNGIALFVDLRRLSGLTASANNVMSVYLNPTVSGAGTAKTPQNMRPASPSLSIATLTSGPSISANGTLIESLACPAFSTSTSNGLLILDPGQSLLITVTTANSAVVNAQIGWFEI